MEYRIPHYFNDFRCVAAECEDTCCAGWQIVIDEQSLEKYKNTGGQLGKRLQESIDWKRGSFLQHKRRCAFLDDDNLCDLHILGDEHMLCDTCRDYPRHKEEYEGLREGSLSLSCIEAAKIILGCKEPVQFYTFEDEEEDEEFEDFDYLLFTKLMDAREKIILTLQNRALHIMVRIAYVLDLTEKLQAALDANELFRMDEWIEQFGDEEDIWRFQKEMQDNQEDSFDYGSAIRKVFRTFYKLEVLKEDWPEYVKKAEVTLYGEGLSVYGENRHRFHNSVGLQSASDAVWSCWLEQLMVYFVFTYFCGAVYDDRIAAKMQIAVVSVLLIQELVLANWISQGDTIDFSDFVDIAHRVSREIEHSDLNLNRLEKLCEKTPVLHVRSLQNILMRIS